MAKNYSHDGDIVKMPCGATVKSGEMVKLSSNTIVPLTKGTPLYGIALTDGVTDEWIAVSKKGVYRFPVYSTTNFAPGDYVYGYNSTTIYAGAASEYSIGTVVDDDPPASSTDVKVRITCSDNEVIQHAS